MKISEAIEKAIEGGWYGAGGEYPHTKEQQEHLLKLINQKEVGGVMADSILRDGLLDPLFWQCLGRSLWWRGEKIRMCVGCGVALRWNEKETMDGKHGGKNGCGSDIYEYEGQWLIEMHKLVDHLAEGKNIEDYFATL